MNKIEITDYDHVQKLQEWVVLDKVVEAAQAKAEECRILGMGVMVDYLKLMLAESSERAKIQNIMVAMRNGLNPETHGLELIIENRRFYLKGAPYTNGDPK